MALVSLPDPYGPPPAGVRPYFAAAGATLYLGDMRDLVPRLQVRVDAVIADPPYGETRLAWDTWPTGWPDVAALAGSSMWCFGSLRALLGHVGDFAGWTLSHDIVWEKHNGSGFAADRFRKVHENVSHWYRGAWSAIRHEVPRVAHDGPYRGTRRAARAGSAHLGENNGHNRPWLDDGMRLMRSVIRARSMHGRAIHPTEKPIELLDPMIRYVCPPGGTVLDPFAGSCSTGVAALAAGRRAVLIESNERHCEDAARRLEAIANA